jgi:hypothetical protein
VKQFTLVKDGVRDSANHLDQWSLLLLLEAQGDSSQFDTMSLRLRYQVEKLEGYFRR